MYRPTQSELHVHCGRGAFQYPERSYDGWWHAILWLVDLEVLEGPLGLSAPVFAGIDLNLSEGIAFRSCGLYSIPVSVVSREHRRGMPTMLADWMRAKVGTD